MELETKVIDGIEFAVTPFRFWEARKLERRVAKLALPVLGNVIEGFSEMKEFDLSKMNIKEGSITNAIQTLFESLTENEYVELLMLILSNVQATIKDQQGKRVQVSLANESQYDAVFGTHVGVMYKVIGFVAEVNFPDYFGKIRGIGEKITKAVTSELENSDKINV